MKTVFLTVTALFLFVFVSCGGENMDGIVEKIQTKVSATEGGTVALLSGDALVQIPAGALEKDTIITIVSKKRDGYPVEDSLVSSVYEFGPSGTIFLEPIALGIKPYAGYVPADGKVPVGSILVTATLRNGTWHFGGGQGAQVGDPIMANGPIMEGAPIMGDAPIMAQVGHFSVFTLMLALKEMCVDEVCQPPCAPDNCTNGCCTLEGVCVTSEDHCGPAGELCNLCGTDETCVNEVCQPPCAPDNCTSGCCTLEGVCVTSEDHCGPAGELCNLCGTDEICVDEVCKPPCAPDNCTSGCCTLEGVCVTSEDHCGPAGELCNLCGTNETCVDSQCQVPVPEGFVLIPAGAFTMGSPEDEPGRHTNETQHLVTLTRPFFLQSTEVTQAQWLAVIGDNPSYHSDCSTCPVETVDWYAVTAYANRLSNAEGLDKCYERTGCWEKPVGGVDHCTSVTFVGLDCTGYRLPTDAEWEYAARAGTTTAFYSGSIDPISDNCDDANLESIGWYCGNSGNETHPAGGLAANAWGLHDMSGNVSEWVWDWHDNFSGTEETDPLGPESPPYSYRVCRSGTYYYVEDEVRSAYRMGNEPAYRSSGLGFRLARSVP